MTYSNIRFIDLPSTKIKGVETIFHSFLAIIASIFHKPDIVHIHNIGPALFSPLLHLFGIKIVLTYHSPNYEHDKWGILAKCLLRLSEKIAISASDSILFVNKFQMEKMRKSFVSICSKSYYVPNGIPAVIPTKNTDYIKSLGLSPEKYIIGVGRITPEKGFDLLIRSFESMQNNDFKLVIVGGVETESNYFRKLKESIKTDKIIFTGYIYGEKLNQVYSHAALYVLSSYNEGFPLVLLEAMKYNLDVLVSDIPATHLVTLDNQDYFKVGNASDLSLMLQAKIKSVRKRYYDLSEFDWRKIAKQVTEIYGKVLND
ncbi:hypothetical protein HMPREF1077_03731 [Parabacteroides johnsonii CL02T12C29]|uniref:Glycosyl transferase family 1 domain-containing protein n=2 Tax=Parabacteroides johnsonii TaxID=387661 RepID=K5Z3Z2_9BACT|nr:hypothetical protein HMPREF1077_03731 [Parabacteroides johnsonii CL02T12C29]